MISKQKHLLQEIRRVRTAVQPVLLLYFQEYKQDKMVGNEHEMLIDAIASRNGGLAERMFVEHVERAGRAANFTQAVKQRRGADKTPA